jgi:hypothetical protein
LVRGPGEIILALRSWAGNGDRADYAVPPAPALCPQQPVASAPLGDARRTAEIDETLLAVSQQYGVSDEQLAVLTGCKVAEIADRRAHALAIAYERAQEPSLAGPPAAPVAETPGKGDVVARALSGAYLMGLLAAVFYYKSSFLQMITVSPLLTTYGLIVVLTSRADSS